MHVTVCDNYDEMSAAALREFTNGISEARVLGLATGSTPLLLYSMLAGEYKKGRLSLADKITFNLDEYYPASRSDTDSYWRYMQDNVFSRLDIRAQNINFPDASLSEEDAVTSYAKAYARSGPVDIQLLGIGCNGHIAFNEPGSQTDSCIRIVRLARDTMERNSTQRDRAITMGIKEIMDSRKIILLASGKEKAHALAYAIKGPVSSALPASFLRRHGNAFVFADASAATLL